MSGKVVPVFLSYVLSFIYVGICWNNHHHLLNTVRRVNGGIRCWLGSEDLRHAFFEDLQTVG